MNENSITQVPNKSLSFLSTDPKHLANRISLMIQNGKKLSPDECMALAQYAVATDLNPFVGECFFIPGVGPTPGIAGWRKKADEQLEYECRKAGHPRAAFWTEYQHPGEGEGSYKDGDIAVKAVLHDDLTKTEWERRVLGHFIKLRAELKQLSSDESWKIAQELVGAEPVWTAIGVVRAGEQFGGTEKMDRYERACKRAEKAAIRKRFPRVYLPEPAGYEGDAMDVIDAQMFDVVTETHTEAENLEAMGFQGTWENVFPDAALKAAREVWSDSAKKTLGELTLEELSNRFNSLERSIKANGLTDEQKADKIAKRDAIKLVMDNFGK